jgi:hypothetical protein
MASPTGPTGPAGPTGIYGLQGPEGLKGARGLIGPTGGGRGDIQTFANMDSVEVYYPAYRAPSGSGNLPPLNGSNSTSIPGLCVYDNTATQGGCNANNVFLVPKGSYFINAMSATQYYQVLSGPYVETYLVLSTCASPTGGSEVNIMEGQRAKQNANVYLSGMFYFSNPTYVGLRQYGGGRPNNEGGALSPYELGYGTDGSLNNVMLSFIKI